MQIRSQDERQKRYFTVSTYSKERYSITYFSFTKINEGDKTILLHGSGLKYNSLFTKLVIAKRITARYLMNFLSVIHSIIPVKPVRTSKLSVLA